MITLKVGIDNYSLAPLQLSPLATLEWAHQHDAEGVAFSGIEPEHRKKLDSSCLKELGQYANAHHLYLEWGGGQHIPRTMDSWNKKDLFNINQDAAKQASMLGSRIVRSCSGGLMRWNPTSPMTATLLQETATALQAQRQMLMDQNVILAIETHFEFTTHELRILFDLCEAEPGEYLGICLDTMNLLTMLEHPTRATERILPWIVSTHIKDGALLLTTEGLVSFPVEIGAGIIDLPNIIRLLKTLSRQVHLSIEDHGGQFTLPIFDPLFLAKFPDLVTGEFASLIRLAMITASKIEQGRCKIIERSQWAKLCEKRIEQDVLKLKAIQNN